MPIINGMYQKQGSEFKGEVLFHDEKHFCLEMAGAYDIDTLSSLKRSFGLEEGGILIEDEFFFSEEAGEIIERFILSEEPVINGTYIQIGSQKMTGEFDKYNISVRKEDYAGSLGKPKSVYVLDFALKSREKHIKCVFCIAG